MKRFFASIVFFLILSSINVKANEFCSAFNLINHIQTKFNNTQNVTYLLKQTQKIAAYTIQKLYAEIKTEYAPHMDKELASTNNDVKSLDAESLAKIGSLFGENYIGEFGANDLLDLCQMSQTYDEAYEKLSQSVRYIVDDMMKDLESLFNKERSDIVDKVFVENIDLIQDLKLSEPHNMHNLVNMIQFYKEVTMPDLCSFEEKSMKIRKKFQNKETLNELLLNFQYHLGNYIQENVMPSLISNRKWLVSKVMLDDAKHMDSLYKLIEVTGRNKTPVDLCDFKKSLNDLIAMFKVENQFILEQLISNFYQILFSKMANFRQEFLDQNLSLLYNLDTKEPYNTHELGDLYSIWKTNGLGDACRFQANLNSLLKQIKTNEGRAYINKFIASLQYYLKKEADAVFLKLETENEITLKNLLDESQQDFIHYQKLKLTLSHDLNTDSVYDMCHIVKNLSKIMQKFTSENGPIVQRIINIVYEDLFEKRMETLYQIFFGENKEIVIKIMDTQDMKIFLSIGKLLGFTLTDDETTNVN